MFVTSQWLSVAEVHVHLNQLEDASQALDKAFEAVHTIPETIFEPNLYRFRGELRQRLPNPALDEAEADFQYAVRLAQERSSHAMGLRAALSLGHLWEAQGKYSDIRELLGPIVNRLSEGFDIPDLVDATALLSRVT